MAIDRAIRCGSALGDNLPSGKRSPLHLKMWGPRSNLHVQIEDLREATWLEIPETYLDLLDMASYVYCADQSIRRGSETDADFGQAWRRSLHFAIPVRQPSFWRRQPILDALISTLSFLSEDTYSFHFESYPNPPKYDQYLSYSQDRFGGTVQEVVLFSGGLDSLAGAVDSALVRKRQVALVNHRPNPKLEGVTHCLGSARK